jgi:hypothetical protein
MATDVKPELDPSVTTLVSGIIGDAQDLLKQQFDLLKHEVREDIRKTKDASLIVGLAVGFGFVGAVLLGLMFVYLLALTEPALPLWACFGICGGVILVVGIVLYFVGLAKFNSFNPLEDQTAQTIKENVQWITNPK